jgi:hypothetical protein
MVDQNENPEPGVIVEPAMVPVPSSRPSFWPRVLLGIGILVLFVAGVSGGLILGGRAFAGASQNVQFPEWVYSSSLSLDGYKAAVAMGDSFRSLPCYCDCGKASKHTSLHDCFFKKDGTFNDHASACDVCGKEAIDALAWQKSGNSLKEIRQQIDTKYHDYGSPTDTPFPS